MQICDFCSSPEVDWAYPAESFETYAVVMPDGAMVATSEGWWASCSPCAQLIEAGRWAELAGRSLDYLPLPEPVANRTAALQRLAVLHQQFQTSRTGPAIPMPRN